MVICFVLVTNTAIDTRISQNSYHRHLTYRVDSRLTNECYATPSARNRIGKESVAEIISILFRSVRSCIVNRLKFLQMA